MKKKDGFPGQLSYVIPEKIISLIKSNPLISDLYITDIGYYPKAMYHYRERVNGSEQYILIYCVEGFGKIRVGGMEFRINADQFFIIPSQVQHSYRSDIQDPWSIYWIHFSGKKAAEFNKYAYKIIDIDRSRTSRIADRINIFSEIFRNLDRGFSIETLEYINLCLGYLLSSFTHLSQFRTINQTGENDFIIRAINFMLENLKRKLKLEVIVAELDLSSSHFSRLFREQTGHSPIEYFIQLKMQRACRLLDNSGLLITDVARELGFDDPFYFSRLFRKVMSMSPLEYRRRGR